MKTSAVLAILGLVTTLTGTAVAQGRGGIDQTTKTALLTALDKERLAEAYYKSATVRFGDVQPFANLAQAEVRHQESIITALKRYGVAVPGNPYTGGSSNVPDTFAAACTLAINEENADAARLARLANATKVQMVKDLFLNLRSINLERHIPALERGSQDGPCTMSNGQGKGNGTGVCDGTGPRGNGNGGQGGRGNGGQGGRGNGNGGRGNGGSGNGNGGRGHGGGNGNGGRGGR